MAKAKSETSALSRIRDAAHQKSNQSLLSAWFKRNYAGFAVIMDCQPRPGWNVIAAELTADGITKGDGSAITAAYARYNWWKIKKAHEGFAAAQAARQADPAIEQPTPAAQPPPKPTASPASTSPDPRPGAMPAPAFDPTEGSDAPKPTPRFGVSKLRD